MTEAESLARFTQNGSLRARKAELARDLQAAAVSGDEARITPLLTELLRFQGVPQGQRVSLQLKALLSLMRALRSMALTDEPTGLLNWRGFVQIGTRLLEVARRDALPAHLVYFNIGTVLQDNITAGPSVRELLVRQTANFMRDLFPSYGVYEVLSRLSLAEFAALTTSPQHASRSAVALRLHRPQRAGLNVPALSLEIGVAQFDPRRPVALDELLADAKENMDVHRRATRTASTELTPQTA